MTIELIQVLDAPDQIGEIFLIQRTVLQCGDGCGRSLVRFRAALGRSDHGQACRLLGVGGLLGRLRADLLRQLVVGE